MIYRRSPAGIRRALAALHPDRDRDLCDRLRQALERHAAYEPDEPTAAVEIRGQEDIHRIVTAHGDFELAQRGGATGYDSTDRGTGYTRG